MPYSINDIGKPPIKRAAGRKPKDGALTKGPKGMFFDPARWQDLAFLKQCDERFKVHQLDCLSFFALEENTNAFSLFITDAPYGTQADKTVDPPWDKSMVTSVIAGMRRCAKEQCAAVIGLGDVHQCVMWVDAFKSDGWNTEMNPRAVMYAGGHRQKCLFVKRQLATSVHIVHHYYVVAYLGCEGTRQLPVRGPFGFFDKSSWQASSVFTGCPMMTPSVPSTGRRRERLPHRREEHG